MLRDLRKLIKQISGQNITRKLYAPVRVRLKMYHVFCTEMYVRISNVFSCITNEREYINARIARIWGNYPKDWIVHDQKERWYNWNDWNCAIFSPKKCRIIPLKKTNGLSIFDITHESNYQEINLKRIVKSTKRYSNRVEKTHVVRTCFKTSKTFHNMKTPLESRSLSN